MAKLRPVTIIPSDLYVERSADRQLHQILTDMGRPGYILVARQMGKTNLLLNARRKLESEHAKFVYIDLSNKVGSLAEYYTQVLKTAAEVHPEFLAIESQLIDGIKRAPDAASLNGAFDICLRAVLKAYKGKVVIVLDEVDSLQHSGFSDQVFSQIRSMYFAGRSNFDDYNRLTYVLSGVAEPSDLIKDKSISPFNIGHKIYLNDFTESEFYSFLKKAELRLDEGASQRVYHWARGNPRMTWDICSELQGGGQEPYEDLRIDEAYVDGVVHRLYLSSFDRAPVDHIRTIVESDREIRDSLIALRRGGDAKLPGAMRSRLYLAGIVSSSGDDQPVAIKNPIIDECVSQSWLEGLEVQYRGLLAIGREAFSAGRNVEAIAYFERYHAESSLNPSSPDAFILGLSYFLTGSFENALSWLSGYAKDGPIADRSEAQFYVARCYQLTSRFDDAISSYRTIVEGGDMAPFFDIARAYLAASLIVKDLNEHEAEARSIIDEILGEPSGESEARRTFAGARVQAASTLASLHRISGDLDKAISVLEIAIDSAPEAYRPTLMLQMAEVATLREEPAALYLERLVEALTTKSPPPPAPGQTDRAESLDSILRRALALLRMSPDEVGFEKLLAVAKAKVAGEGIALYSVYERMWEAASLIHHVRTPAPILLDIVENFEGVPDAVLLRRRAFAALIADRDEGHRSKYASEYLSMLEAAGGGDLVSVDYLALNYISGKALEAQALTEMGRSVQFVDSIVVSSPPTLSEVIYVYYGMYLSSLLSEGEKALSRAIRVLELIDLVPHVSSSERSVSIVRNGARQIAISLGWGKGDPVRNEFRSIGRNDRVKVRYKKDGVEVENKFKHLERDLSLGLCTIVTSSEH